MKTLKIKFPKTAIILLLITVMLSSCSSSDDSVVELALQDSFLTAKIDGVDFSSEITNLIENEDPGSYGILGIKLSENASINIILDNLVSTGTFTTEGDEVGVEFSVTTQDIIWGAVEGLGSGTITITENSDTYLKGTFSFTAIKPLDNDGTTKEVTEGAFKVKKQ